MSFTVAGPPKSPSTTRQREDDGSGANPIPTDRANPRSCKYPSPSPSLVPPRPSVRRLSAYLFFVLPELAHCETEVVDGQAGGHRRGDKTQIRFDVAEEGMPAISDH